MDASPYASQAILAVVLPNLLQWLKGYNKFPLMSYTSGKLNFWFTGFIAACASLGVHFTFSAAAGTLVISGLTLATIWSGIQHVLLQWVAQHYVYKTTIAPSLAGAVQAASRAEPTAEVIEPMVSPKAPDQGPAKDPPKP